MKKREDFKIIALLILLTTLVINSSQGEESPGSKQELLEAIGEVVKETSVVNHEASEIGLIKAHCPECSEKAPHFKLTLDKDEKDLGTPYYLRSKEPYLIFIKRTSSSPKKVDLKFQNGHRYCEKMFMGTNPWANGSLVMGCMLYLTRFEESEISLDMRNLPPLKEGEEELIELKLFKKDLHSAKYTIGVVHYGEKSSTANIDKKFFGSGYNVKFDPVNRGNEK